MASTYSTNLRLELQTTGENRGSWGAKANNDFVLVEQAITGFQTIGMSDANYTLTALNAAQDQSRNAFLSFTGALTADRQVIIPAVSKSYVVYNATTGGFNLIVKASGSTTEPTAAVPPGRWIALMTDGASVWAVNATSISGRRYNTTPYVDATGYTRLGRYIELFNSDGATDFAARVDTNNTTTDIYHTPAGGSTPYKIWTAGNDGAGSGLDADTLDGFHAQDIGFQAGTRIPFNQSTAPVGWTKDLTHDNKALRIVNGTVTTGGSVAFTTAFSSARQSSSVAAGGTIGGTALTEANLPPHAHFVSANTGLQSHDHAHYTSGVTDVQGLHGHDMAGGVAHNQGGNGTMVGGGPAAFSQIPLNGAHQHNWGGWSGGVNQNHYHGFSAWSTATGSGTTHTHTFTGVAHTHTTNLEVQYVDFIICEKD